MLHYTVLVSFTIEFRQFSWWFLDRATTLYFLKTLHKNWNIPNNRENTLYAVMFKKSAQHTPWEQCVLERVLVCHLIWVLNFNCQNTTLQCLNIRWQTGTLFKTHCSHGVSWGDFLNMVAYSVFSLLCGIFQFLCSIFRNYEVIARSKNHQMTWLNSMVKFTNTV